MNDSEIKRRAKVFLSYASSDRASARFIADALRQAGISTLFDEWEIRVGDSIVQKIEDGVKSSDYIRLLLSPAAVESPWVKDEISSSLSRELKERAVRPIRTRGGLRNPFRSEGTDNTSICGEPSGKSESDASWSKCRPFPLSASRI